MNSLREALAMMCRGCGDLGEATTEAIVRDVLSQRFDAAQTAGLLAALQIRGESANEVVGAVRAIQSLQLFVGTSDSTAIDVGGTGGDFGATFNVSTTAAIVAAAAGAVIYKHGGAAVTGSCGSMDLLRALHLRTATDARSAEKHIERYSLCFLSSADYLKFPAQLRTIRAALGIPTLFSLSAPWCNPARVRRQIIGVCQPRYIPVFCAVAQQLARERVLIIHGINGATDEFSIAGPTLVSEFRSGTIEQFEVTPRDFGYVDSPPSAIRGSDSEASRELALAVLEGRDHGPARQTVAMTASACLYLSGIEGTLFSGVQRVESTIDAGCAADLLQAMVAM